MATPLTFGQIQRFAGEHLGTTYNAVDNKLGGFLPGGVEADGIDFVKEVARDAMPGQRVHGEQTAERLANNADDIGRGRIDLTTTRSQAGRVGGKAREHVVEEALERVGREAIDRIATRGGAYGIPVVGQAAAIGDTIMDGFNIYDTAIGLTTGKGFGQHVDDTIGMRNSRSGSANLFPQAGYVGEGVHTLNQGKKVNPIAQEINNRATQVSRNFNPLKGDWGLSETMGWN